MSVKSYCLTVLIAQRNLLLPPTGVGFREYLSWRFSVSTFQFCLGVLVSSVSFCGLSLRVSVNKKYQFHFEVAL